MDPARHGLGVICDSRASRLAAGGVPEEGTPAAARNATRRFT